MRSDFMQSERCESVHMSMWGKWFVKETRSRDCHLAGGRSPTLETLVGELCCPTLRKPV